ncbi:hypothetical protein OG203_14720 [Nocardia sp. NBC_01499]|uniref:hypothetical protein n=1 Tax=Nocardia sp. NBC_01499 TaxID=2903597 RepID=UPI00386DD258
MTLLAIGPQIGITERLIFYPRPTWMAVTGAAIALKPIRPPLVHETPPQAVSVA